MSSPLNDEMMLEWELSKSACRGSAVSYIAQRAVRVPRQQLCQQRRGARLRVARLRRSGDVPFEDLRARCRRRTRVALSRIQVPVGRCPLYSARRSGMLHFELELDGARRPRRLARTLQLAPTSARYNVLRTHKRTTQRPAIRRHSCPEHSSVQQARSSSR